MNSIKAEEEKKREVKVVKMQDQGSAISSQDALMDARAVQAVRSALSKAKFCQKPIAKYDMVTKKPYIEYANGDKVYVK